jgi:uncharacterized delta-60 repeat protein
MKHHIRRSVVTLSALVLAFALEGSSARAEGAAARFTAAGALDASFGSGGTKVTQPRYGYHGAAARSGSKLVVGGTLKNDPSSTIYVSRWNADGSADATFGASGTATAKFSAGSSPQETLNGVAVTSGGKVVALGYSDDPTSSTARAFLVRWSDNGSLDMTYGSSGFSQPFMGAAVAANLMAVDPATDKIAVLHSTNFDAMRLSVLKANGVVDLTVTPSFCTAQAPGSLGGEVATAIEFDSLGRIVIGGRNSAGTPVVMRLNANGTRDTSFAQGGTSTTCGTNGVREVDFGGTVGETQGLLVDGLNRIVVSAQRDADSVAYVRLGASGAPDGWSGSFKVTGGIRPVADIYAVSGGYLMAGTGGFGSATKFYAFKVSSTSGAVVTSYGASGTATAPFPTFTDVSANGFVVDSSDRAVIVGAVDRY